MKNTIVVICQNNECGKIICNSLANKLDMYYSDINELLEYNFINEKMKKNCGLDYYKKEVEKYITSFKNFQNALLRVDYKFLKIGDTWNKLKDNLLFIYVKDIKNPFSKREEQKLLNGTDFTICYSKFDEKIILEKIMYALRLYYNV